MLDLIQLNLEKSISNWEIISTEDLFDEDQDEVIRVLNFNRGEKDYFIIVNPKCYIRAKSSKISSSLLVDLHNALNTILWKILRSSPAVPV